MKLSEYVFKQLNRERDYHGRFIKKVKQDWDDETNEN